MSLYDHTNINLFTTVHVNIAQAMYKHYINILKYILSNIIYLFICLINIDFYAC